MITRAFNADPFLANMISFLQLNEIPPFAIINKSTARVVHELNVSEKFQLHSGVMLALIESLQRDAKLILDNPSYKKDNASLTKALENIMAGNINYTTIKAFREERLMYQTHSPEQNIRNAGEITLSGLRALSKVNIKGDINAYIFLALLLISVLLVLVSVIEYGVRSGVNYCRARKQQDKLSQRLAFFKNTDDTKDEKKSCSPNAKSPSLN